MLRAVEVRHRDRQRPAEHVARGQVLGHLVDARGAEDVLRPERLCQRAHVELEVDDVRRRVADVERHGVAAVLLEDRRQAAVDLGQRLVPGRLRERPVALDERRAQAVRVVVDRAQRPALGADEPVREDVVGVAGDARDAVLVERDGQAAGGLAQRAGDVRGGRHGETAISWAWRTRSRTSRNRTAS